MIDGSYERIRRPAEGRGLGPVGSLLLAARIFWGEVALGHDQQVKGPVSSQESEAIRDVTIGNLLLNKGLNLTPEEADAYQQAQQLINTNRPMGLRVNQRTIRQPQQ